MQCPTCFKEFKNYNSYRVHRWRFHNPNTKYGRPRGIEGEDAAGIPPDSSLALPVAAATVGLAVASGGSWKKWLILLLVLLGLGIVIWYLATKKREEERLAGT
jgi:uncharacterized membrane protein